jgi:hypothetical protein
VSLTEIASDSTNAPEDAAQARLQLSAQSIVLRVTWPPSPPSSLHALVSASTIGRLVRTVQWMCAARRTACPRIADGNIDRHSRPIGRNGRRPTRPIFPMRAHSTHGVKGFDGYVSRDTSSRKPETSPLHPMNGGHAETISVHGVTCVSVGTSRPPAGHAACPLVRR